MEASGLTYFTISQQKLQVLLIKLDLVKQASTYWSW
jgi:hypothetical protein